jgi:hypothetical protein
MNKTYINSHLFLLWSFFITTSFPRHGNMGLAAECMKRLTVIIHYKPGGLKQQKFMIAVLEAISPKPRLGVPCCF